MIIKFNFTALKQTLMKKIIFTLLTVFLYSSTFAQNPGDTIVVQTFDYSMTYGDGPWSSHGNRDTVAHFPNDPNLTFEKIILSYNMRCKDNVVNNDGSANHIGCGAWDYSCNTYIHDSTRVDSLLSSQPSHSISGFNGNAYDYTTSPVYNYYQFQQQLTTLNTVINEDTTVVGSGNDSLNFVIATDQKAHKSQFLYKADELLSLGLINDSIDALSLNVLNSNQTANFLSIKLKLTNDSVLSNTNPHTTGFTEVYNANTTLTNGLNRFQFTTPFNWDSASNIIVEFSLTNSTTGITTMIAGEQQSNTMGIFSNDAKHAILSSAENANIPANALNNISNEITISFWVNGNANVLPQNTSIIEAFDSLGNRTFNIHFPWNNGNIYWDCGNDYTSSYDRIDKAASPSEYTNSWSHWTFTKNSTTGNMKIYRNGVLWHSGTGKTRAMSVDLLMLGSAGNGTSNFWDGAIKELRVFNTELPINTINDWIYKRVNNTHPNYTNLVAHYPLNEGIGSTINDNTPNQQIATFNGNLGWNYTRGNNISQFFTETTYRPNINFYQGDYSLTLTTSTVSDSLIASPNTINAYAISPNYGTLLNDDIITTSTNTYWEAVSHTYNGNGVLISSTPTTIDGTISITSLPYYKRFPMAFQIMSFVTPYGAGLDLGVDGKTWYFDLTDFAPIFKGNKRITMDAGGQWQEDMDIKFLFIVGTPPRDVLEMQQIWKVQSKGYSDIIADNSFEDRNVTLNANASAYKVRTVISGHGQEGEFIPQNHSINIDGGTPEDTWQVWTECSENPIYPQGGTWIYDRAGWCPGQATDIQETDITPFTTPGQTHNIDYTVLSGSGTSNYWVSSQLVSYGAPNFSLDAAVVDILSPTNKINYKRTNPICSRPEIIIQNTGSTALTSLTIEYWINNAATKETYTWNGNLNFLEKETIQLPDPASLWNAMSITNNTFHVEISAPNNGSDSYIHNNYISSTFEPAPTYPNTFALWVQTNSGVTNTFTQVSETSWEFFNNQGASILASGNLISNSQYRDTLTFNDGCYTFKVTDTDDDGIDFWANNDGGGMIRFREIGASWIKTFEGDFGRSIYHQFRAETVSSTFNQDQINWNIHPNPTKNEITINGLITEDTKITLVNNLGKTVQVLEINKTGLQTQIMNLSNLSNGVYFIKISNAKESITKKIVKI